MHKLTVTKNNVEVGGHPPTQQRSEESWLHAAAAADFLSLVVHAGFLSLTLEVDTYSSRFTQHLKYLKRMTGNADGLKDELATGVAYLAN